MLQFAPGDGSSGNLLNYSDRWPGSGHPVVAPGSTLRPRLSDFDLRDPSPAIPDARTWILISTVCSENCAFSTLSVVGKLGNWGNLFFFTSDFLKRDNRECSIVFVNQSNEGIGELVLYESNLWRGLQELQRIMNIIKSVRNGNMVRRIFDSRNEVMRRSISNNKYYGGKKDQFNSLRETLFRRGNIETR